MAVIFDSKKFIFIAGPCVIEDQEQVLDIAQSLKEITKKFAVQFVFKASFDKANRTSVSSYRGPGLIKGIEILEQVKKQVEVPILSDIHTPQQVDYVKDVLDIIQIPAFLARQTDLVVAAAKTKKLINIKKAQFMSPDDMKYVLEKAISVGNRKLMVTERGSCFGYNNLVVDFRSFLIMKKFGFPVIYDVTHSLQRPSAKGKVSGGDPQFVLPLARAAVACGIDGIFMEVHPQPKKALSDKHTSFSLNKVSLFLEEITKIKEALGVKK